MDVVDKKTGSCHSTLKWHLQTLACITFMTVCICGLFVSVPLVLYILLYTRYYPLVLLYYAWVWYDHDSSDSFRRRSQRVRDSAFWRYLSDYFPVRLVKTAELDPTMSYMFCSFPHGMLALGTFISFGTNATKVNEAFPNHKCYMATLAYHFKLFYIRELGHALGLCTASPKAISNVLSKPKTLTVIAVGGASEAFYSRPGQYTIFLKQRKGFVKLALKHGTPLVPVISFGETNIYAQVDFPEGSRFRRFQEFIRKKTTVAPILAYGNGPLPYRREMIVVVGKPLPMEKILNPTQEQIDDLHQKFITELTALFEEKKKLYLANHENIHLIIK
ncbi:2-acylglycerol O-acyltransferase 1-like isoform X1 [Periplaneta americana]|uniref:2-acylglycerol O-acyltransferase 1-like isoform X1 n=1 Tax=Periplaneta americana TaxID=6978 RepID=UPI0037E8F063